MTKQVCTSCNNITDEGLLRGSGWIELILWLAYIVPGVCSGQVILATV